MAIETNTLIDFFGTEDTVTSSSSAVSDGAFSSSSDVTAWANDDDAVFADIVFTGQYPSGTLDDPAPVHLYERKMNVDGSADEAQPDAGHKKGYIGTFFIDPNLGTATNTSDSIQIPLRNNYTSQQYEFYIENQSGVQISAGWTLKITPKAIGPHA